MGLRFGSLLSMSSLLLWMWTIHNSARVVPSLALSSTVPPSSTTHFHLQFDGCFRPPRDPGFPTIDHRMAVCGACIGRVVDAYEYACENETEIEIAIHKDHKNGDNELRDTNNPKRTVIPLAVGAMEIPVSTETTSQHAEYEGLLLGLEWFLEFLPNAHERVFLTIEGDCKTVIDQLNGKSVPRKLESLHQRAEGLLDQLAAAEIALSSNPATGKDRFTAEYCHIPRSQNLISDSLCNTLMAILSAKSWVDRIHELEQAENRILEDWRSSSPSQKHPEPTPLPLSDLLETAVRTTKYSLRLVLYERVANLAIQTQDFKLLIHLGEILVQEASSLANNNPTAVKRMGVHYQIQGWEGLGKEKKTRFLTRKHRLLLSTNDGCDDTSSGVNNYDEEPIAFVAQGQEFGGKQVPVSEPTKPRKNIQNEKVRNMGDVTEGEWNALIPHVWKPLLDQWFVAARYPKRVDKVAVVVDKPLPVWVSTNT